MLDIGLLPARRPARGSATTAATRRDRTRAARMNRSLESLNRIFGEGPKFQISDGLSESPSNFERLLLGCIDADFCKQILKTRWKALDEICTAQRSTFRCFLMELITVGPISTDFGLIFLISQYLYTYYNCNQQQCVH